MLYVNHASVKMEEKVRLSLNHILIFLLTANPSLFLPGCSLGLAQRLLALFACAASHQSCFVIIVFTHTHVNSHKYLMSPFLDSVLSYPFMHSCIIYSLFPSPKHLRQLFFCFHILKLCKNYNGRKSKEEGNCT